MSTAAVIDAPVFRSTRHALHVSFLVMSLPPTTVSPTAIVIDMLVKQNHVWDGVPMERASQVNFSGLNPLEVRAQCAQVVAMVNHLPHHAYRDALKAIYGHQAIKSEGVRGLAAYAEPLLSHLQADTIKYVAWHVFATPRQRDGLTLAEIGKEHGLSVQAVQRAKGKIIQQARALHARACDVLAQRFTSGGLVEEA